MEIAYYFKNLPPTDAIKAYATKKIDKRTIADKRRPNQRGPM